MIRRRLKFAAVLVVVVLALTGFSSGSKSKGSSSSGGGCSSSKKKNNSYTSSDDDLDDADDVSGSSGGSYTDPTPTATSGSGGVEARIVTCARKAKGKQKAVTFATVEVTAPAGLSDTYDVRVSFRNATGSLIDTGDTEVTLDGGESTTVRVPMDAPGQVSRVTRCEAGAAVSY